MVESTKGTVEVTVEAADDTVEETVETVEKPVGGTVGKVVEEAVKEAATIRDGLPMLKIVFYAFANSEAAFSVIFLLLAVEALSGARNS
ncbi:hypothetical protein HOY80DRAFT_1059565 [Tuber brumale]|nr:hypothetical protein HOY80DRAFT_1067455 [Tuber brumale]KAG0634631.1 hypothetical protein HOY80DRAFT_1059565 [Tuber brumale]